MLTTNAMLSRHLLCTNRVMMQKVWKIVVKTLLFASFAVILGGKTCFFLKIMVSRICSKSIRDVRVGLKCLFYSLNHGINPGFFLLAVNGGFWYVIKYKNGKNRLKSVKTLYFWLKYVKKTTKIQCKNT